jgi:hypothetical protein
MAYFQAYLTQVEGVEGMADDDNNDDKTETSPPALEWLDIKDDDDKNKAYFSTHFGEVSGIETVAILNDQSTIHAVTHVDAFRTSQNCLEKSSIFTFEDRYSAITFQGIMPDSGAAGVSTAGEPQFLALQKLDPTVKLDTSTAGHHQIRFGKGTAISQGTIHVSTPLGTITFHVVPINTPFLFCIQDMDKMGVKLDNLENILIQGNIIIPVIRK